MQLQIQTIVRPATKFDEAANYVPICEQVTCDPVPMSGEHKHK